LHERELVAGLEAHRGTARTAAPNRIEHVQQLGLRPIQVSRFQIRQSHRSMNVNVQQRVIKVVCEVTDLKEEDIKLTTSLSNDLKMDSLQRMTLFIALEDEFQDDSMPPEQVAGLATVQDIIGFIDKKLKQSPPA
jgi:acyl carrier protein